MAPPTTHPNADRIARFYAAFAALDAEGMAALYAPDARFADEHRDRFDFWAWSRQALGAPGLLLGWTPFLRAKVRTQAAARLDAWRAKAGR